MKVFDWYVFRNLAIATVFITICLAGVVFLTQSLRFLELVIDAGASSGSFWILTLLALPRFFEIILPLGLMAGIVFVFNRMAIDSELVAIRTAGFSPLSIATPALVLALIVTVFLWFMTMWAAPKSLATMQHMQQVVKAQISSLLFREGVFNQFGSGLTVFVRKRESEGELRGIMIHDSRPISKNASTILAKTGTIIAADGAYQVVVFDGSRQEYDNETDVLNTLNFERYTIDLPSQNPVRQRWAEPDERTIMELFSPDLSNTRDMENLREFSVEIHRRFSSPLLSLAFTLIACSFLLSGPMDRRGQGKRIAAIIVACILIQGLYLVTYNLAQRSDFGLPLMYVLVMGPIGAGIVLLSGVSDRLRRQLFYAEAQG